MVEAPQLPVIIRGQLLEANDVQDDGKEVQKHVDPNEQKAFEMVIVELDIGLPLHVELTQKYQHQNGLEDSACAVIFFVPSDGNEHFGIHLEVTHRAQPCLVVSSFSLCDGHIF
tara:strand:+ start:242 stop:583 length:342 start_codon:yes stop_codon:yes gene_type:complete